MLPLSSVGAGKAAVPHVTSPVTGILGHQWQVWGESPQSGGHTPYHSNPAGHMTMLIDRVVRHMCVVAGGVIIMHSYHCNFTF